MTDIIASPAVKEAVKIVMEQQERLGKNAAEAVSAATTVSAADLPGASQPIRASVLRAAQLAHEAEDHARNRQHVKGKLTARERLDLLLDTGSSRKSDDSAAATSTADARERRSSPVSAKCSDAKWPYTHRTFPCAAARWESRKAARSAD